MLSKDDIKQLISLKTETRNLDYKQDLNWNSSSKDKKVEIVKDILAMANTQDGGKIIIGVRNEDYEFVGMDPENFKSFDPTTLNQFVHKYTDPNHSSEVYKHKIDDNYVVAIDVPEFEEVPVICQKEYHSSEDSSKQILRKGQIYIRTDKATSEPISSPDEMRILLGRALTKKGDELLRTIQRLITGKPVAPSNVSKEEYTSELRGSEKYLSEKIGEELKDRGYWTVISYPTQYDPLLVSDVRTIRKLIKQCEVRLRGWPFPHSDDLNASNFSKGRQSHTIWNRFREGYRAYQSGLFVAKKAFWEDVEERKAGDGKRLLSFIYSIYLVTEFFLFFRRYYGTIAPESDIHFEIGLHSIKDRRIVSFNPSINLYPFHIAEEDSILIKDNAKVVDLEASFKELANRVIRQIFFAFNWDEIGEKAIEEWQDRLLGGEA